MKQQFQEIVFKKLLKEIGISPAEIEVIEPVIVTPESNVERFYKWLEMCNNQYIGDIERVTKAFHKVALNS